MIPNPMGNCCEHPGQSNLELTREEDSIKHENDSPLVPKKLEIQVKQGKEEKKTLILIDGTVSMSLAIAGLKNNLIAIFKEISSTIREKQLENILIKVQIALYRDYDSGPKLILEKSGWEGSPEELVSFLKKMKTKGGGDFPEAVEVGLRFANILAEEDKLDQVILIADAPAKERNAIERDRKRYGEEEDWLSEIGPLTDWREETEKLKKKGVLVHTLHLLEEPDVRKFYPDDAEALECAIALKKNFIEISNITGGNNNYIFEEIIQDPSSSVYKNYMTPLLLRSINEKLYHECVADIKESQKFADIIKNKLLDIKNIKVEGRSEEFLKYCKALEKEPQSKLGPNPNSLLVTCSNKELINMLMELKIPEGFLETTRQSEMENVVMQIEAITGYDLITGKESEITFLKLKSKTIDESNILQEEPKAVEKSFKKDLAKALGIEEEKINIRRIVPGSFECYFSISEDGIKVNNLLSTDFASLKSLIGQADMEKIQVELETRFPDKLLAYQLLNKYTTPLIVETKSRESELKKKFGKYLHLLATINNNIRVKHDEAKGVLEIFGPPDQRASIIAFFADIENLISGNDNDNVVICPQNDYNDSLGIDHFWDELYDRAKNFAINSCFTPQFILQANSLRMNPNLKKGSPAAIKFYKALEKCGLDPKVVSFNEIFEKGIFGWHGTRSAHNVASIAYGNLDPTIRSWQSYGRGEYCAIDPNYSMNGYWGDTLTLFVFFILKISPYYKLNTHHVVDNPLNSEEIYMVPILIATFNQQNPLDLIPKDIKYEPDFDWEWKDDKGWTLYGVGQPIQNESQTLIENMHKKFKIDGFSSKITLSFVRLRDSKIDPYEIDFSNYPKMTQRNTRTQFVREVQRKLRATSVKNENGVYLRTGNNPPPPVEEN